MGHEPLKSLVQQKELIAQFHLFTALQGQYLQYFLKNNKSLPSKLRVEKSKVTDITQAFERLNSLVDKLKEEGDNLCG